jgi:hypothetical protein
VRGLHLIYFKKKYYVIKNETLEKLNFVPYLIDKSYETGDIVFNEHVISKQDILNILKNQSVFLPCNIKLYTSYSFVRHHHTKQIQENIIANYISQSKNNYKDTLHLFIIPFLSNKDFYCCILTNIKDLVSFHTNDKFSINHVTEGKKLFYEKTDKEETLNQEHCICEHQDTQRIFLPSPQSFKPLASQKSQKYFLLENLGK